MIIKSIELENFRQFKKTHIDFAYEGPGGKNITIVLGQNTVGKTTLVKAFIWCIYGINEFDDKQLLSKTVADSLQPGKTATAKVTVELEHQDVLYRIITREVYRKGVNSNKLTIEEKTTREVYKVTDTSFHIPHIQTSTVINSILREELRDYFFFDGESNKIEDITTRSNIKDAVLDLLNLNTLNTLLEYYDPSRNKSVISSLRNEISANTPAESLFDNIEDQLDDQKSRRSQLNADLLKAKEELRQLEVFKADLEDQISANADVLDKQKLKEKYSLIVSEGHENIPKYFDNLISSINKGNALLKTLFYQSYHDFGLEDKLSHTTFNTKNSYVGINADGVDALLKAHRCVCGAEIKDGSEAYYHLLEAQKHMEPHDYSTQVSDFNSSESSNGSNCRSIVNDIRRNANLVLDTIEEVDNTSDALKDVQKILANRNDVGSLQKDANEAEGHITYLKDQISGIEDQLPNVEKKIANLENKQIENAEKNSANSKLIECLHLAGKIYDAGSQKIRELDIKYRDKLIDSVQKVFNDLYTGKREISISDNYVVSVAPNTDTSTGFKIVLNFSFVIGLMNLAKETASTESQGNFIDEDAEDYEEYPLVLDAPLSATDDEHINHIATALADNCDQVIMFLMKKDYRYAEAEIADKIGKKYRLVKDDEYESHIEEDH